jgi:hypothetical protein
VKAISSLIHLLISPALYRVEMYPLDFIVVTSTLSRKVITTKKENSITWPNSSVVPCLGNRFHRMTCVSSDRQTAIMIDTSLFYIADSWNFNTYLLWVSNILNRFLSNVKMTNRKLALCKVIRLLLRRYAEPYLLSHIFLRFVIWLNSFTLFDSF